MYDLYSKEEYFTEYVSKSDKERDRTIVKNFYFSESNYSDMMKWHVSQVLALSTDGWLKLNEKARRAFKPSATTTTQAPEAIQKALPNIRVDL